MPRTGTELVGTHAKLFCPKDGCANAQANADYEAIRAAIQASLPR